MDTETVLWGLIHLNKCVCSGSNNPVIALTSTPGEPTGAKAPQGCKNSFGEKCLGNILLWMRELKSLAPASCLRILGCTDRLAPALQFYCNQIHVFSRPEIQPLCRLSSQSYSPFQSRFSSQLSWEMPLCFPLVPALALHAPLWINYPPAGTLSQTILSHRDYKTMGSSHPSTTACELEA